MKETNRYDVIIIGAGLTGLTAAFYLKRANKNILVIDKATTAGGVIKTVRKDNFIYETGPNTGALGSGEVAELFEDLGDKVELQIANPDAKKRLILKNDRWEPLPSGLLSAIKTPLFTWYDKFKILGEPWRKRGDNPMESMADMVVRRMGKSFLDYAIDPFISGIYSGDPNLLVTKYAMPKLYELEQTYGSFIRGALKKRKIPKTDLEKKATKDVFTAKGGLSQLINALVEAIGNDQITLSANELQIEPQVEGFKTTWTVDNEMFEATSNNVITTTGAYALPSILPFIYPFALKNLSDLKYVPVRQIIAGFTKWDGIPLDAFGGLVPSCEKKDFLGVLFNSTLFSGRAPKDGAIFSIFVGGIHHPELTEMPLEKLMEQLQPSLCKIMGVKIFSPDLLKSYTHKKAIPQYGKESKERLETIKKIQHQYPGLLIAGNIRNGIGMSDRAKQGRQLADEIINKNL